MLTKKSEKTKVNAMKSSVDISNPIYERSFSREPEPKFRSEKFTDKFMDDADDEFMCTVCYDVYEYCGEKRIAKCGFDPMPPYYMTNESLIESVKESIILAEGFVMFECPPEKYEPKY